MHDQPVRCWHCRMILIDPKRYAVIQDFTGRRVERPSCRECWQTAATNVDNNIRRDNVVAVRAPSSDSLDTRPIPKGDGKSH